MNNDEKSANLEMDCVKSIHDKSDQTDNEAIDKCEKWLTNCDLSDCSTYDNISICSETTTSFDDNFSYIDKEGIVSKRNNNVKICDAMIVKDEVINLFFKSSKVQCLFLVLHIFHLNHNMRVVFIKQGTKKL